MPALSARPFPGDSVNALALGGADCLWDDVARSEELLGEGWWDTAIACNEAGAAWPERLDHWASLHPDKLKRIWMPKRDGNDDYEVWTDPRSGRTDPEAAQDNSDVADRLLNNWGGSSGLFCVQIADEIGAERILVCGMPMEAQPHFHGRAEWTAFEGFREAWEENLSEYGDRTRSMSGWTAELLGGPTRDWLARDRATA